MYRETDEYGQYQLDSRLSSERTMEENVAVMIGFAAGIAKDQAGEKKVKNRHEGYGILAEEHQKVIAAMKLLKDGMGDYLDALQATDSQAIDRVQSVANALALVVLTSTRMAAEATRVSNDLYQASWKDTEQLPLETYTEENDGFEDPETEE